AAGGTPPPRGGAGGKKGGGRVSVASPPLFARGGVVPGGVRALLPPARGLGFHSAGAQESGRWAKTPFWRLPARAYAAACTQRLRLGCVVFVSTLHSPVHLAKSVATLDQLSRGRIEAGFGTGGGARPFAAFGVDKQRYVARFTEGLELMKRLWTESGVTFHGEV